MTVLGICLPFFEIVAAGAAAAAWPTLGSIARRRSADARCASRLAGRAGGGRQSESLGEIDADLARRRALRGRGAARTRSVGAGRRRRPGRPFKKLTLLQPERRSTGAGRRPRQARGARRRAAAGRGRPAVAEAGRSSASSLAWALPDGADEREREPRGGARRPARSSASTASTASSHATPTTRRRASSTRWCSLAERCRGGRAAAEAARIAAEAAEPRPRPAEPALERRHPHLPGRSRRGDRRRPRRGQRRGPRPRARSRPWGWAAWPPSPRAAPRSRG